MYIKILIMVILIAIGFLLKKTGLLSKKDGEVLLTKLVFYIFMPAAVFLSMSRIAISGSLFLLPLSAAIIMIICLAASFFYARWRKIENKTRGAVIITAMTLNMAMVAYPLFQLAYGDEGFARVVIFDFAVAIITFSLVYFIAVHYGDESKYGKIRGSLVKTVKLPALWALILGIGMNLSGVPLPTFLQDSLELMGKPLTPSLLIAMGLYFEPKLYKARLLIPVIAIKMSIGLAVGFLLVWLFDLNGLSKLVVIIASIAPSGYNTIVYSVKEKLNEEFAVAMVAATVVINIVLIPLLIMFI